MKKILAIFLALSVMTGFASVLCADQGVKSATSQSQDTTSYRLAVGEKAARGVKNVLTGWMEIPKGIVDVTQASKDPKNPAPGVIWGFLAGTFQGTIKAMVKTASGTVDIVTAPITPEKDPFIPPDLNMD